MVARHLNPSNPDRGLALERLGAGRVRSCPALGLVQLVVQSLGNLVALLVVVRDNLPVRALFDLQTEDAIDRRLDDRFDCRRNAQLALALKHLGVQLIAVVVVRLFICSCTPRRLLLNLVDPAGKGRQVQGLGLLLLGHQKALQLGGGTGRWTGLAFPALRAPSHA